MQWSIGAHDITSYVNNTERYGEAAGYSATEGAVLQTKMEHIDGTLK